MKKQDDHNHVHGATPAAGAIPDDSAMPVVDDAGDDAAASLTACQTERDEWKTKYYRALADYQNLEKRTSVQRLEDRKFLAEVLLAQLLPVGDTLIRAQQHLQDQGLGLAIKEFVSFLESQGVKKLVVEGRPFDPMQMECIEVVEGKEDHVVAEILPGYVLHDKILRVAQVKVGRKKE